MAKWATNPASRPSTRLASGIVEVFEVALRELFSLSEEDEADHSKRHQRATLIPVATSLARYVAYILGGAIALSELGVDTTPLLAAASLVGVAVGLGAQAIVSDLASGAALLLASAEGAFLNVRINAAFLTNRDLADRTIVRATSVLTEIRRHQGAIAVSVDKMLS